MWKSVMAALALVAGTANAEQLTATFKGVDSGTTFSVSFSDDKPYTTMYWDIMPSDIHWSNFADALPYYAADEWAGVESKSGPKQDGFLAYSSKAQAGLMVDMDYFGTTVHVSVSGLGYRYDSLTLGHFDWTGIDTSKPGWGSEFFKRAADATFVATQRLDFTVYAGYFISTDGPITVEQIASGGPWFDGIPYADVQKAVIAQYPFLGTRTENMKLVSVSAVPELGAFWLALTSFAAAGAIRAGYGKSTQTDRRRLVAAQGRPEGDRS